jgi:pSer/pThr/pTyr-binding forkhead associated (FHA) protein
MAKLLIQMPDGQEITHDLPEDTTTIGRRPDNSLQIEDASVSSHHAEIFFENNAFFVKDLGSTNGTYLNGGQIKKAPLNHDDELRFGSIVTEFKSLNDSGELVVDDGEAESLETQTKIGRASCRERV